MVFSKNNALSIVTVLLFSSVMDVHADTLNKTIETENATNQAAIRSQKTIDKLHDEERSMLEQYRSISRQLETLQTYNQHIGKLLKSQEAEKLSLQQQLEEIEITQQEVLPLALNMLQSLETFVQLDIPFLPEERAKRIATLTDMTSKADVTHAEKFRRILEAYQIENDYGNTIEAYSADLDFNGHHKTVDFFRLGRLALYYQTLDGNESGYWDAQNKQWKVLPAQYRKSIQDGIRMARKQNAPDLLSLPLPAAGAVQ